MRVHRESRRPGPALHALADRLPADTAWIDVESPFSADQLEVHVVNRISTRFQHRAVPGNYLAFFSGFDYFEQVAQAFAEHHPSIPAFSQSRHGRSRARA